MKKIITLLLAAVCAVTLASCKNSNAVNSEPSSPSAPVDREITLLYSQTDSLNPYAAKTEQNRRLATLIYDPLYKVDAAYKPETCVAASCTAEGNTYTVRLNNINFTDGTPLTSSDVLYSFGLARASVSSGFAATLSVIAEAHAADPYTVIFTAQHYDQYFLNLLTFPVIKEGSAGLADSDGVEIPPVGSGRYIPDTANVCLIRNEEYFGIRGVVKHINLLASPDSESASHYVQTGSTDLYFTASDSEIFRMSGKRYEIDLNRLVYIGVNSSYGALGNREMRYAISSAIDRTAIVDNAYYNAAVCASGYFNPALQDVNAASTLLPQADSEITVENLAKIGYNIKDAAGYYSSAYGYRAAATLLVNSDNPSRVAAARLIAAQCKSAGIEITVEEVPFETYLNRLKTGSFQLYLGEIEVMPDMDLSGLVIPGGGAAYGVVENPQSDTGMTVSQAIAAYEAGQISLSAVSGVLITEMPQIPICYRKGFLFFGDRIKSGVEGLSCDIYYSIASYKF